MKKEEIQRQQELEEEALKHTWDNREEIEKSDKCICIACSTWFPPEKVSKWHEGKHACCPNPECGLACVVLGSASGLNLNDYDANR